MVCNKIFNSKTAKIDGKITNSVKPFIFACPLFSRVSHLPY